MLVSRKGEENWEGTEEGRMVMSGWEQGREAMCQGTKGQQRRDLPCQK